MALRVGPHDGTAPQDEKGGYSRPKYSFGGVLGGPEFPFQAGRYHVYCEFAPFLGAQFFRPYSSS